MPYGNMVYRDIDFIYHERFSSYDGTKKTIGSSKKQHVFTLEIQIHFQ